MVFIGRDTALGWKRVSLKGTKEEVLDYEKKCGLNIRPKGLSEHIWIEL